MKQQFAACTGRHPSLRLARCASICLAALGTSAAFAQSMQGMDHSQMQGMDHGQMKAPGAMQGMNHCVVQGMDQREKKKSPQRTDRSPKKKPSVTPPMDHGSMKGMNHGDMEGRDHDSMKTPGAVPAMHHGQMKHFESVPGMEHSQIKAPDAMQGMDHSKMEGMDHGSNRGSGAMPGMDHGEMKGMGSMQGGSAPPDARDPDAYSNGLPLTMLPGMDMADNDPYGQLLLDQFEGYRSSSGESGIRFDAQAWYGTDLNKLWLKAEGGRSGGKLGETRAEVLYNRAFAPYFGWQAGVRHDFGGGGPGRNWGAVGVQGLAPYWFDVEATAYVGPSGRTAFRFKGEYDLRITQRLVLQPDLEFDLYGKSDPERGIGSGLSEADLGFRLRYEITRKFAPYIGVSWGRKFGNTADMARRSGKPVGESRIIAGIRLWF